MCTKRQTQESFTATLSTIASNWEQPRHSLSVECIDCYIHTMEYCTEMKRNRFHLGIAPWIDFRN